MVDRRPVYVAFTIKENSAESHGSGRLVRGCLQSHELQQGLGRAFQKYKDLDKAQGQKKVNNPKLKARHLADAHRLSDPSMIQPHSFVSFPPKSRGCPDL